MVLSNGVLAENKELVIANANDTVEIKFVETEQTFQFQDGKPLVNIHAMIEYAKTDLLIVNSDIIIKDLPELKQDGRVIYENFFFALSKSSALSFSRAWKSSPTS